MLLPVQLLRFTPHNLRDKCNLNKQMQPLPPPQQEKQKQKKTEQMRANPISFFFALMLLSTFFFVSMSIMSVLPITLLSSFTRTPGGTSPSTSMCSNPSSFIVGHFSLSHSLLSQRYRWLAHGLAHRPRHAQNTPAKCYLVGFSNVSSFLPRPSFASSWMKVR